MPLWLQIAIPAYVLPAIGYSYWAAIMFADKKMFTMQGPPGSGWDSKTSLQIGMYIGCFMVGLLWPIVAAKTVYGWFRDDDDKGNDDDAPPPTSPTP